MKVTPCKGVINKEDLLIGNTHCFLRGKTMATVDKWKSTGVIGVRKGMTERNKVMLPVWLHVYQVIFKKHPAPKPLSPDSSDFFFLSTLQFIK